MSALTIFDIGNYMFCTECGHQIVSNARFCQHCGKQEVSAQNIQSGGFVFEQDQAINKNAEDTNLNSTVRQNLKKFNVHTNMICFECGYSGLMGVTKIIVPWYMSWWFFIPMCFVPALFGAGFIGSLVIGGVWGILRSVIKKTQAVCPSCNTQLTSGELI